MGGPLATRLTHSVTVNLSDYLWVDDGVRESFSCVQDKPQFGAVKQ